MSNFVERLNDLLVDRGISPECLAAAINVSTQTVYAWKSGKQQIFLSNLISLCDYLDCSAEFISGRGDTELGFTPQTPPPFSQAVRKMMGRKGITTYRLRKDTRYDGSYFARWDRGAKPYLSTLTELADYLGCTIDQLVGREN